MTTAPTPMRRTSRDPEMLRRRLEEWLRATVDPVAAVSDVRGTDANGMSSDTVLFEARWNGAAAPLVARIAPALDDVPVFPAYDMVGQFETIRLVHQHTDVGVPVPLWCEPSAEPLGAPFFVMTRVDGDVPPDVLPYTFGGNWLFDAAPEQQRRLQESTIAAIAQLHAIARPTEVFGFLERTDPGETHLRRHVAHTRAWYDTVAAGGAPSPLVERAFAWLDARWPEQESAPVLCWGDSRIGNVIYSDFTPAALLDWEMAGLGPRELDVGWLVAAHVVFQDLATALGVPGLPDFLRAEDVTAHYAMLTGHHLHDLGWYLVYSVLQWAVVFLRTGQRQAHFGERELPADPEELIYCRGLLERLLAE